LATQGFARSVPPAPTSFGLSDEAIRVFAHMSDDNFTADVDDDRVATRAQLVGKEHDVGSDDPTAQARTILEDSELRTVDREAAPGSFVEHRRSEDTVPPEDTAAP
jgi:hypothetical protein